MPCIGITKRIKKQLSSLNDLLIQKGGGTGPLKPWQPGIFKVPIPDLNERK